MNITKEQYEIIQDIYRERRRRALEIQQEKRAEIDRRIPQLAALEESIPEEQRNAVRRIRSELKQLEE